MSNAIHIKPAGRTCEVCKKPISSGMTDDWGNFFCCEDCFDQYMDKEYGKGNWKSTDIVNGEHLDDGCGGFYVFLTPEGNWEGTGAYYTEWYED